MAAGQIPYFQHWVPETLKIPNEPGKPGIDLMASFCLPEKQPPPDPVFYRGKTCRGSTFLPPSARKPKWEEKGYLISQAKQAAASQGTCKLRPYRSREKRKSQHGEIQLAMCCEYCRKAYLSGKAKKRLEGFQEAQDGSGSHFPSYQEGARRDRYVSKSAATRPGGGPARIEASKLAEGFQCKFQLVF